MRIRGRSAVLWREPGVSQIGTEAGRTTVLVGLSSSEQHFLDQLPTAMSRGSVYHLARRTRVPVSRARSIVDDLEAHGALVDGPGTGPSLPDDVYWDRLGADASARSRVLESACVAVHGSGALAQELGLWLAEAGVGTILSPSRHQRGGLEEALEARAPAVRTRAGLRTRPDLMITLEAHVIDPLRARRLAQEALAHLPVLVREVSVRVGPVLGSGGVCATCLNLWERDADPCWPALATQMRTLPPPELEHLLSHQAAVLAARAAIEVLLEQADAAHREGGPDGPDRSDGADSADSAGGAGDADGHGGAEGAGCADPAPPGPGTPAPARSTEPAGAAGSAGAAGTAGRAGSTGSSGSSGSARPAGRTAAAGPAEPRLLPPDHLAWNHHSAEISGTDPLGLRRRWQPHPECLCSELA